MLTCNAVRGATRYNRGSHDHGRLVHTQTATDKDFWDQGIPNGTAGIPSIFKDHLGPIFFGRAGVVADGPHRLGHGVGYVGLFTRFLPAENWDVNAEGVVRGVRIRTASCARRSSIFIYFVLRAKYCSLPGRDIIDRGPD